MRFGFLRSGTVLASLTILTLASAAHAQNYTIWSSVAATSASGAIADPGGAINVNLTFANSTGPDQFFGIMNSSTFGTFNSTLSTNDVYEPNPPGTSDFFGGVAGSNTATYTLTFSRPVIDPVFHIYNLDFRRFNFSGGVTTSIVSGLNMFSSGSVVGDTDSSTFDNAGADPTKGNPNGSGYGSFQVAGTFTSLTFTRPLGPGAPSPTDGYYMGISAAGVAVNGPEPGALALFAVGAMGFVLRRRK